MLKVATIILVIFLTTGINVAMGGTFLDEFSTKLDEKSWTIIKDAKNASVEVKDGKLVIQGGAGAAWNITGIRFLQTVDLTMGKCVVECDVLTPSSQFLICFTTSPTEGDPWNAQSYWAWLIAGSVWKWESNAVGVKATLNPMPNIPINQKDKHHYYVEHNPTKNKEKFDTYTEVDKGKTGKSSSELSIGPASKDANKIYIYVCVGDDGVGAGPSFIDNVSITSDSIQSVSPKGRLATIWAQLKSEYNKLSNRNAFRKMKVKAR